MKDDERFEKPKPSGYETVIVVYNRLDYVLYACN